jgi:type II secretory pathway component PulC
VIRIAGTSVGSPDDVREALARVEDGANVEVTVVRRGSRRELQAER